MKARIKKTGEIVKLADYAVITLDSHDSYGNPIELKPEEVELIQEPNEDEHWHDVRERAAISALQGVISNQKIVLALASDKIINNIATIAICLADALVEQLKGK